MILRFWNVIELFYNRNEKRVNLLTVLIGFGFSFFSINKEISLIIFALCLIVILSLTLEHFFNGTIPYFLRFTISFLLIFIFLSPYIIAFSAYIGEILFQKRETTISNLLLCLGSTGGEQRYTKLSGCLKGVSLPSTTTADQILDILGSIPRNSMQRHDAMVDILKKNKINISGHDAIRLLSAFEAELRRLSLTDISCHIERPISDSDKSELLKNVSPIWVHDVRQQLEKTSNPHCEM